MIRGYCYEDNDVVSKKAAVGGCLEMVNDFVFIWGIDFMLFPSITFRDDHEIG